jgi:hypothetical protein
MGGLTLPAPYGLYPWRVMPGRRNGATRSAKSQSSTIAYLSWCD